MRMNKQIKLYSISLGMAKTDEEKWYYRMKYINESSMYKIKKQISAKFPKFCLQAVLDLQAGTKNQKTKQSKQTELQNCGILKAQA